MCEQADYREVKGDRFALPADAELVLHDVSDEVRHGDFVSFSLCFHGAPDRAMEQGTYELTHPRLGKLHVFLVPVGPVGNVVEYEAVFSQRVRETQS